MLLTWVALALTVPAMHLCLTHNALPFPEPSAAIATTPKSQISPVELQALRIKFYQQATPPVFPAAERLRVSSTSPPTATITGVKSAQYPSLKPWIGLALADHAAAGFDAWSTRASLQAGLTRELNPLVRPFSHSAVVYPVLQFVPIASDFLSRKMMRSSHPLLQRIWWLPQITSMTTSILSGIHNLQFTH